MNHFLLWLLSFTNSTLAESRRRVQQANAAREQKEREARAIKAELAAERIRISQMATDIQERLRQYDVLLSTAERLNGSYERIIEEEREKIRVHETTIETLVAANNLHLRRLDAETAVEVRRKMVQLPREQ